jgi:GNAT superfamily N-acetyltransferase
MVQRVTIRRAGLADIRLLDKFQKQFYKELREIVSRENPLLKAYLKPSRQGHRFVVKLLRKWIRSKNALVLIAEEESNPIGFTTVSIEKHPILGLKRYGYIGFMFMKPRHRSKGISSLLMKETLAWLARRRVKHVGLSVEMENKYAHAIYRRWGFRSFSVFMWKIE